MKNVLQTLVEETLDLDQPNNQPILNPNAYTVALYKSITNLIYQDIVQISETKTRVANVFCWEHLDSNGELIVNTPATYSGMFGIEERKILKDKGEIFPDKTNFSKDDYFLFGEVVLQAIVDNPFDGFDGEDDDKVAMAFFHGNIRYVSDASKKDGMIPSESQFRMKSWRGNVGSRKIRLDITTEASQDLSSYLNQDSRNEIIGSLAMIISDDINKDVIHKLMCISKKYSSEKYGNKPFIDLSVDDRDGYLLGRELYSIIMDMIAQVTDETKFTPNYIITSPRVAGLINASGMCESANKKGVDVKDKYILNDGTVMRVDVASKFDYIIVGVNTKFASSLYLSNFVQQVQFKEGDDLKSVNLGSFGIYKVTNPNNMSDSYMCNARYALTAPPYTYGEDDQDGSIIFGDEWEKLANNSPLSRMVGVLLPKLK